MKITVKEFPKRGNDVVIEHDSVRAERYLRNDFINTFMLYHKDEGAPIAHREWKDSELTKGERVALFAYMDKLTREYLGTTFDAALEAYQRHEAKNQG